MLSLALIGPANPLTGHMMLGAALERLAELMTKKELRLRPREVISIHEFGLFSAQEWFLKIKQKLIALNEIAMEEDREFLAILFADVVFPAKIYFELESFARSLSRVRSSLLPRLVVDLLRSQNMPSPIGIISQSERCGDDIYTALLHDLGLEAIDVPYLAVEKSRKKPVHTCDVMILAEGAAAMPLYKGTTLMVDPAEVLKQHLPRLLGFD